MKTKHNKLEFEKNSYKFLLEAAQSEDSRSRCDHLMKAARSFEMSQPWRLSYYCWRCCADELHSLIGDDDLEKPQLKNTSSLLSPLIEKFSVYNVTDENWENPAKKTYIKENGRNATDPEKFRHKLAWVYDFAAQSASRNNDHSNASEMNRKAGACWRTCKTFPKNDFIAAKFYTYSACERILAIGRRYFSESKVDVASDIKNIIACTFENASFKKYASDPNAKGEDYRKLSFFFHSIGKYAKEAGLIEIVDQCTQLENKALRRYYNANKFRSKKFWNTLMHFVSLNGTSYKRFLYVTLAIALVLYPSSYYIIGKVFDYGGVYADEVEISDFFGFIYFSVVTITTLGYGDLHPEGLVRIIAISEAVLGYVILGIFVWLLTRRM